MYYKRGQNRSKGWSMSAESHRAVSSLLEEDDLTFTFHPVDQVQCEKEYDTNVMGRFNCPNQKCSSVGWSSKKIAITIRMYTRRRYNARIYHQRCDACNQTSEPILDDSYAERVAYRLKKWSGVDVEAPPYSDKSGLPHRQDLCEGCQAGHCTVKKRSVY